MSHNATVEAIALGLVHRLVLLLTLVGPMSTFTASIALVWVGSFTSFSGLELYLYVVDHVQEIVLLLDQDVLLLDQSI